ncbi:alpha/beta hydrolase family protein [Pseudonocardia acaciae]|uniref:alpha/beta hydrolase family protein n=1 Tax=Pseudonocardia acaciae TaxID=551276 RepID=UPI0004916C03|nr:alpha/beta hydrolase [Pseudonocardia acaciae]
MGWKAATAAMAIAVLASGCGPSPGPVGEDLQVRLGDWVSDARIDRPDLPGRVPTVVLVHGTGPRDRSGAVEGVDGAVRSRIFDDIARYLSARGIAVVRYDKRYVRGRGNLDQRFATLTQRQMVDDIGAVVQAATARDPHLDPDRVFLYGWSEGTAVAAEYAATHPEVAGLVLQAGVNVGWRDGLLYQGLRTAVPYLDRYASAGRIGADGLGRAWRGGGGLAAKEWITFLAPRAADGDPTPDRRFDRNGDGAIDLRGELEPALPSFVDALLAPDAPLAGFGPGRGLLPVTEQAPRLPMPVLALQGLEDGNVPPDSARALDAALGRAGNPDHALRLYPGLGHSLGDAASPSDDDMLPIRDAPLADVADWLRRHS